MGFKKAKTEAHSDELKQKESSMKFKDWKIKTKILTCSMLLVFITVIFGILSFVYIGKVADALTGITDNNAMAVEYATGVERMALSTIMEEKNYLLEETDEVRQRAEANVVELYGWLDKVDSLATLYNNEELLKQSEVARTGTEEYAEKYREGVALLQTNKDMVEAMRVNGNTFVQMCEDFNNDQYEQYKKEEAQRKDTRARVEKYVIVGKIKELGLVIRRNEKNEMLYKNREYYARMLEDKEKINPLLDDLTKLTKQKHNLTQIENTRKAAEEYFQAAQGWIDNDNELVQILADMKKLGDNVILQAQSSEEAGYAQLEVAKAGAQTVVATANMIIIATIIIAVILGVIIGIFLATIITKPIVIMVSAMEKLGANDLTASVDIDSKDEIGVMAGAFNNTTTKLKDVMKQINTSSGEVGNASTQISSASEQLAAGAEEQQAQLSEVATTMEEMSAMILEASKNANETRENAQHTGNTATQGREVVTKTVTGFESVVSTVEQAAKQIQELSKRSVEIGNVIQVIDDIADQTNLLALNANIEAARAGEAGKGFAVVADEVRKLAERTATATAEIGKMIETIQNDIQNAVTSMEGIQNQTSEGLTLVGESDRSLQEISDNINNVINAVEQIATSTNEQSSGAEEISKNIEGVTTVAKQSASGAQELASSAEQLNKEVEGLNQLIGQFKVE